MDITNVPIECVNAERKCYIFFADNNKCIGEFKEQSNDAGEIQYVWDMYWNVLETFDYSRVILPAINLMRREFPYIRTGGIPYYIECSTIPDFRGDLPGRLERLKMDCNDRFEYMIRTRGITNKTNCYLGRTPTDTFDCVAYKKDLYREREGIPNFPCGNRENDYYRLE